MNEVYKSKFFTFYIVLLLIMTSGTVLVGQLYYQPGLALLFVSSLFMFKQEFNSTKLLLVIYLIIILFMNFLITLPGDIFFYIGLGIKIIAVTLILNTLQIKKAVSFYIYILAAICILSLIFYVFGLVNPNFVRNNIPLIEVWGHGVRITPFYVYQDWIFTRNNGVYWEPGAFQAFINISILLTIKSDMKSNKKRNFLILFIITLFTTFSTTGYLVFLLILISQLRALKLNVKKLILIFGGILSIILVEGQFKVISNKFNSNSESYASFLRRSYDFNMGLELIHRKPIFGWGFENTDIFKLFSYQSSSNGLLMLGVSVGLPALIAYIIVYYINIKKVVWSKKESILLVLVFIIFISTENLMFQPLFLAPLFLLNSPWRKIEINEIVIRR